MRSFFTKYYQSYETEKDEMGRVDVHVAYTSRRGKCKIAYKILVGKLEGKRAVGRHRNNAETGLTQPEREDLG
jgi:hypothetical protein